MNAAIGTWVRSVSEIKSGDQMLAAASAAQMAQTVMAA